MTNVLSTEGIDIKFALKFDGLSNLYPKEMFEVDNFVADSCRSAVQ